MIASRRLRNPPLGPRKGTEEPEAVECEGRRTWVKAAFHAWELSRLRSRSAIGSFCTEFNGLHPVSWADTDAGNRLRAERETASSC